MLFVILVAVLFTAIVGGFVKPSAMDYSRVAKSYQGNPDGIEATRWTTKSGATVYECWWFVGSRDAVYLVTNPPAEIAESAKQQGWISSVLCGNRLWIPIAGLTLGLSLLGLAARLSRKLSRPRAAVAYKPSREQSSRDRVLPGLK